MNQSIGLYEWPHAFGGAVSQGSIRQSPDDFIVCEQLGFTPSGRGEHVFLLLEKRGENTAYVAGQLAQFARVAIRDIGFAGLKDRHAKTTQWFSIWLPGRDEPDWSEFSSDSIKVLKVDRHLRKLKRAALSGNQFAIKIRDWQGDLYQTIARLEQIKKYGIPNYFGEQRFGHQGRNIENALALFKGAKIKRQQRSIYLSAARSYLFNQILSKRVASQNWNQAVSGDLLMLDRTGSFFKSENLDENIFQRIYTGKIHPTGALWGQGKSDLGGAAQEIEKSIMCQHRELAEGLERMRLKIDRRALRVNLDSLNWRSIDHQTIELNFYLPAGSYATAVLRECFNYKES